MDSADKMARELVRAWSNRHPHIDFNHSEGLELDTRIAQAIRDALRDDPGRVEAARIGYLTGHEDTVESRFADPLEVAQDICQDLSEEKIAEDPPTCPECGEPTTTVTRCPTESCPGSNA